jgi:ketosteroid isomerase-like protein
MQKLLLLINILAFSMFANAQSKDEAAIAGAVEKLRIAMIEADKTELESLVSDKLSYGHSGGHIDDKKEFVEKLVSGKSDFVTIDLREQTISISKKTAIVRHILSAKSNDDGKPGEVQLRVLLIWQKVNGRWILLARQALKMS